MRLACHLLTQCLTTSCVELLGPRNGHRILVQPCRVHVLGQLVVRRASKLRLLTASFIHEPTKQMWETAGRAGVITANQMWYVSFFNMLICSILTCNRPGPPITVSGASSTYFVPWRDKVPLQEKLDQILEWVDIEDIEKRPELILSK